MRDMVRGHDSLQGRSNTENVPDFGVSFKTDHRLITWRHSRQCRRLQACQSPHADDHAPIRLEDGFLIVNST